MKTFFCLGMVHVHNFCTEEEETGDHEFKASLVYIARLGPAWVTCDSVLKSKIQGRLLRPPPPPPHLPPQKARCGVSQCKASGSKQV